MENFKPPPTGAESKCVLSRAAMMTRERTSTVAISAESNAAVVTRRRVIADSTGMSSRSVFLLRRPIPEWPSHTFLQREAHHPLHSNIFLEQETRSADQHPAFVIPSCRQAEVSNRTSRIVNSVDLVSPSPLSFRLAQFQFYGTQLTSITIYR